ncbi:ROK family transcriptional regulator [Nonomuraea sp. NPDC049152]|uniref:ROK family transcriptional regulator n=1 Tax=Nonomuraea sp. NPDC049152 TaxID=3154350 RepID=UPI003409D931
MKTATPAMARAINDRLALDLLLERGPLTAPQLRTFTGLSRPTVSDLIERLMDGGLIEVTGECGEDRRGPKARLYGIVAGRAHVAGVDVRRMAINVTVADLTGATVGTAVRDIPATGGRDAPERVGLAELVESAVAAAAGGRTLDTVVIGAPGLVDPRRGDLVSDNGVPGWEPGFLESVRHRMGVPVVLENEVNLAAIAEHRTGAAGGNDDFVLLWLDDGVGAAVVLDGRLRRGVSGGAGEIGLLDVNGSTYCDLVDASVARGLDDGELAGVIATGAFALVTVLDPGLVVLGGKTGRAGGDELAGLVAERLHELSPAPTRVLGSTVAGNAILQGAVLTALDTARDKIFG